MNKLFLVLMGFAMGIAVSLDFDVPKLIKEFPQNFSSTKTDIIPQEASRYYKLVEDEIAANEIKSPNLFGFESMVNQIDAGKFKLRHFHNGNNSQDFFVYYKGEELPLASGEAKDLFKKAQLKGNIVFTQYDRLSEL